MSSGCEVTSKVPTLFRCAVPLVIQDAERFFNTDKSSLTGPHVNFQLSAGSSAWMTLAVRATSKNKKVHFDLMVRPNIDLELDTELSLKVQSPAGDYMNSSETEFGKLKFKKDEWGVGMITYYTFDYVEKNELFDGNLHLHADVSCEILNETPQLLLDLTSIVKKFSEPVHSDFVLISEDGRQIRTHKMLLESVSPVFRAMLATDCQESREDCCKIPDFDGETISSMLACILGSETGDMEFGLTAKLVKLADKYEILPLKSKCVHQLVRKLSVENVVDALLLADEHSAPELKSAGFSFMENNWMDIIINDIGDTLRHASSPLYKEWQQRLGFARRKRAAEGSSSDSPSKKKPEV